MRPLAIILLTLVGLGGSGMLAGTAQAQSYPWCVVYTGDQADGGEHCIFVSYAQCMQTATPGSGAFCTRNPGWRGG